MKNTFKYYKKIDKGQYDEIWSNAIIIFDTNILLNLFRYPETARIDYLKVISKVQEQLWIPFISGLEFYENLDFVIASQISVYGKINKIITKLRESQNSQFSQFVEDVKKLNLVDRHINLSEEELISSIEESYNTYRENLEQRLEKFSYRNDTFKIQEKKIQEKNAKLLDKLEQILDGKIGSPPSSQKEIDEWNTQAKKRYENLVPPGYKDEKKGKDSKKKVLFHNGLFFKREYGDYYIWKEILNKGNSLQEKNYSVIFVTDDIKEDWRRIVNGKIIGPRVELVNEIQNFTSGKIDNLIIYDSWRFFSYAVKHFELSIERDTQYSIKAIQKKQQYSLKPKSIIEGVSDTVETFIRRSPGFHQILDKPNIYTFIEQDETWDWNYYEFKLTDSHNYNLDEHIQNILYKEKEGVWNYYWRYYLIIIDPSEEKYNESKPNLIEIAKQLPEKIKIIHTYYWYDEFSTKYELELEN